MNQAAHLEAASPFTALTEYESDHLVTHLIMANYTTGLKRLLSMEADGRHAWSAHKRARDRQAELVTELELARDQAINAGESVLAIRYALIRASLAATANRLPSGLVVAGARYGSLTLAQAISYAMDHVDPAERARLFAALSEVAAGQKATMVAETASLNAIAAIEEIGFSAYGMAVFGDIVGSLTASTVEPAAAAVQRAQPARAGRALFQLARTREHSDPVRQQLLDQACTLARREPDALYRSLLLAELGSASQGKERRRLHTEALVAAGKESDEVYRARLLGQLAPHLAHDQIQSLWREAQGLPSWTLEHGRWRVRQEVVAGVARAAGNAGLHELAADAIAALEDIGWEEAAQLAAIDTAGSLPEPQAGRLLERLADAIEGAPQLGNPMVARLFRLVVPAEKAQSTAKDVSAHYMTKRPDLWLPQETISMTWEISERVVAAAAIRSRHPMLSEQVVQLLDADAKARNLLTDVEFLTEAGLLEMALRAANSATPQARLALAAEVGAMERRPLIESVLAKIGSGDPRDDGLLAARVAELLPADTAIAILRRAQERAERLSDAPIFENMIQAFREPSPTPDFINGAHITAAQPRPNAELSAKIAAAIKLDAREPRYDDPSPRQEQLDILMPQALDRAMFDVYATAAAAYPVRFGWQRAEFLGQLFKAGAYQTAFDSFDQLAGPAASSELAQAAGHLPHNLFTAWMNCVLSLQPPEKRAEPIAAAGHRLLPGNVFERALLASCELKEAEARQTALTGLVSNWQYHSHFEHIKHQRYLRMLLQSGSRIGRLQLGHDLAAVASALREDFSDEDVVEIADAVSDIQRWWP